LGVHADTANAEAVAAVLLAFAASLSLEPPPPVEAQTTTPPSWKLVTDSTTAPDPTFKKVTGLGQGQWVVSHDEFGGFQPDRQEFLTIVLSRPLPTLDGSLRRIVNGVMVNEFRLIEAMPVGYRVVQEGEQLTEELELVVEEVDRRQ
jgi:hypothetical protein